jgi:hypothetical protein
VLQRSFDLSDRHAAAISSIDVASVSIGTVPAKKDLGLHLSKTTSFLVSQIAHSNAAITVNSNVLYFLLPTLD